MNEIEQLDRKRLALMGWSLCGHGLFLLLWLVRFYSRHSGLNDSPFGIIVWIGLILSVLLIGLTSITSLRLARHIRRSSDLSGALHNEWVLQLELKSWKAGFITAAAVTVFFAISHVFYPVCDPVVIAVSTIIAGLGVCQASFFLRYRSS